MTDTLNDRIAKFRELCACFKGHSDDPPDNPCDCTCHENETVPGQREHIAELRSILADYQKRIEVLTESRDLWKAAKESYMQVIADYFGEAQKGGSDEE